MKAQFKDIEFELIQFTEDNYDMIVDRFIRPKYQGYCFIKNKKEHLKDGLFIPVDWEMCKTIHYGDYVCEFNGFTLCFTPIEVERLLNII